MYFKKLALMAALTTTASTAFSGDWTGWQKFENTQGLEFNWKKDFNPYLPNDGVFYKIQFHNFSHHTVTFIWQGVSDTHEQYVHNGFALQSDQFSPVTSFQIPGNLEEVDAQVK